jgi:hypothetical protein
MNNNLKRKIMARIYLEYAKNVFWAYPDYFMFGLFMVVSFTLISVHNVLINMSSIPLTNLSYAFNFFVVALLNTSWIIQVLILGFFIRTAVAGIRFGYKNLGNKWPLTKLFKLKY